MNDSNLKYFKKIYISGPVTGYDLNDRRIDFNNAEHLVKQMFPDATVINPFAATSNYLEIDGFHNLVETVPYSQFMRDDLKLLLECDTICMLPCWEKSNGCRTEISVARSLGMVVIDLSALIKNKLTIHGQYNQ